MANTALDGKPYAGNPHVRIDEGDGASAKPRRSSLLYNKLMITMACLATAVGGSLYAQDPKPAAENTAAAAKATTEKTATKAPDLVAMAKEASRDGGQSIVDKAVEKAPEMNAVKATPQEDAAAVVERKLAAGKLSEGYNRQEKAIIQIGVGAIRIEDPINDKTFMIAREGLALYAYLNAKANVLRAINTEFSAIDRMMTIAEFGEDMTAQKYAAKKAELESRRDVLAKMLKDAEALTAEEADSVKEVTISDRLGAFIDAVIKKIDATYDPKVLESKHLQLSAERKAKIAKLRSECDALLKDYQQLEADAANLGKDPTLETSSDVKM